MIEKRQVKMVAEQGSSDSEWGHGDGKEEVSIVPIEDKFHFGKGKQAKSQIVFSPEQQNQINSRKAWHRCQLGRAFWALGRFQEALEHFEKACQLMPHEPYYRLELAEAYLALNRLDDAINQLEQTVLWAPYDDYYHVRLVAAYLRAGRLDNAIETMEKTVSLNPQNASYHCLLGLIYLMAGDEKRASFHLKFRWKLDQYDLSFLRQFQKLCGKSILFKSFH